MSSKFSRLFTEHPHEVGETYLKHMAASASFGTLLLRLAACAFIHALVPGLHRTTVSDKIRSLATDMTDRADKAREGRMNNAGVWDTGL